MTHAEKDLTTTIDRLVSESSIGRTTPEELHLLDRYHAVGSQAAERLLATASAAPTDWWAFAAYRVGSTSGR